MGAQVTLMVSFQALGKPLQAMVVTMGRQLIIYVPLLLLFNNLFGFEGFIWAQPLADILTAVIAVALGFSLIKLMRGSGDTTTG
jgi:Na+-driven multidrug efflux pump